ncbi:hypothetical protein PV325_005365 [Microctonus aethiopoides]|nr:hypothetical protein PV325_005365 [Microctonus aethiopoides]KAK0084840.1 hypothetical protein PV326_006134 [Microctonus aethiopoides]
MGKKGYNWRARTTPKVEIDNSSTKKIAINIEHREESYDDCNALVLPSDKRIIRSREKKDPTIRLLSKKRRKQLEKVVERKQKKLRRAGLLEDLAKVQAPPEELKQYTSIVTIQTKGLKRHIQEANAIAAKFKGKKHIDDEEASEVVANAIKGSKRIRLDILHDEITEKKFSDPNTIGFDVSSDSEEDDDSRHYSNEVDNEVEEVLHDPGSLNSEQLVEKHAEVSPIPQKIIEINEKLDQSSQKLFVPNIDRKPAVYVTLNRKPEIQADRLKLPILAEEQSIVEAINENPVVIITGETGSGKTTQVPQFLYEAGYAKNKIIGITEPRRVAAMAMSKRIAEEMNLTSTEVSYVIRFAGNVTDDTKIKFMTDGVLLKEVQNDFLLTKYSVIILDEAHERSVFTDILIGLLSRIVPLRAKRGDPLKLVIMSATLRVDDFIDNTKLFKIKPKLIQVDSRQFPVTIHFNRRTSQNYVKDAIKKAVKVHTRLPEGGILIFLTGQHEVNTVVRKLRRAFPYRPKRWKTTTDAIKDDQNKNIVETNEDIEDCSEEEYDARHALHQMKCKRKNQSVELPTIDLDNYSSTPINEISQYLSDNDESDCDELNLDEDEDDDDDILELKNTCNSQPLWVLPLYSLLSAEKQARIFEAAPEGCRLCVVSTNVAETSLTIPHVKYVIDSGYCKTKIYDKVTGVSTYKICYTSQASANQRAGRAGRMGPGHCYRLYSSAVFNDQFDKFSEPEIRRKPIDDLLLQMKVMNIDKVVNFPFPSSPDLIQLKSAEKRLSILGILEQPPTYKQQTYSARPTPLGQSVSAFPVAPRYGKMLAISQQHNLLAYTICMVSALSVQEVFIQSSQGEGAAKNKWLQIRQVWAGCGNSLLLGDPMVLIKAVGAAEYAGSEGNILKFCEENGVRPKAITEVRKLRQQLTNEIVANIPNSKLSIDPHMSPPSDVEAKLLRQIVLAGMADQVAKKVQPDEMTNDEDKTKWRYAYKTTEMEDPIFMHSSCVLRRTRPEWVVYQEIYEINKMYMRGVTAIEPEWLPKFVPSLCNMSEPLSEPPPRYDVGSGKVLCHMSGTFGRAAWELPPIELEYPMNIDGIKWFARFFLAGQVCPKLKRFVPSLLSSPSSINKSWAKLLPRTEAITKILLSKGVMSKEKLMEVWCDDQNFLLNAYQKWLPESAHGEVAILWPPL